jgi:hypothetical protein
MGKILWNFQGETLPIDVWAVRTGIPYHTLYGRVEQMGMPPEQAFSARRLKPGTKKPPRVVRTSDGRQGTLAEWSEWTGYAEVTLRKRLLRMPPDDALVPAPHRSEKRSVRLNMSVLIDRDRG